MKDGLHVASDLIEAILLAARAAYPEECCGLLVGVTAPAPRVLRIVPATNVHPEPRRFFQIDPKTQFATLRALRDSREGEGEEEIILGHYHSHPAGPAEPSPRDLAEANDPDLAWLVIAPQTGQIAGFLPRADGQGRITQFQPIPLLDPGKMEVGSKTS